MTEDSRAIRKIRNSDGEGMIFEPARPLTEVIEAAEARRANSGDALASHYPARTVYERMYSEAFDRLSEPDMLSLEQAAGRFAISPSELLEKTKTGKVLLIEIEGRQFVPAWQLDTQGRIDELKLDIAREFVLEERGYFKFMDYVRFMTEETADIVSTIPKKTLSDMFQQSGLQEYRCGLSVNATMNQLADQRAAHPEFFHTLLTHLEAALTSGGWDPRGGLSRPFRDKYGLPGATIEEQRQSAINKQPKP